MRARAARGQPGTVMKILLCKQINPLMRSMKAAVLLPFSSLAHSIAFRCLPACFARLHWEQSALVTIIFPVSSGFPPGSVLVGSPLNKVDLRASPGFYESKGGAVVRALASHQCGPGSNLGVNAICGLSLLLVLSFAPRGFSPSLCTDPPSLSKNRFFWGEGRSVHRLYFNGFPVFPSP